MAHNPSRPRSHYSPPPDRSAWSCPRTCHLRTGCHKEAWMLQHQCMHVQVLQFYILYEKHYEIAWLGSNNDQMTILIKKHALVSF